MTEPINTTPLWLALRDRSDFAGGAPDLITEDDDTTSVTDEADAHVTAE